MGQEKVESERTLRRKRQVSMAVYEVGRRATSILPKRKKNFGKAGNKLRRRQLIFVWSMLALPIINFLIFWVYVNFDSIMLAFKNIDYANGGREYWTLDNFKEVWRMLQEGNLLHYGLNTLLFWGLGVIMGIPHSIVLTYVFQKKLAGHKIFRVILYIPSIICSVAMAGIFQSFISGNGAFGEILLNVFGWERVPVWFGEEEYAMQALLFYSFFFGFAGNYIIYSGAMSNVDKEITEAAYMDGVCMWQEILYIDIPMMWPTISVTIISTFAGIFGASGAILLFTPYMESTYTFGYWIFDQVRRYNAYYVPSALGLCFTLIAFPISLLIRKGVESMFTTE